MIVRVINPTGARRKKRKPRKSRPARRKNKLTGKVQTMRTKNRARRRGRRRHHNTRRHGTRALRRSRNPVYHVTNRSRSRRRHYRRRRNPDSIGTRMTVNNIAAAGAGAIGGALTYSITNSLLQTTGNGKYLTGVGLSLVGWWLLDKFWKPAAIPFAAGVLAITANDYFQESGMLDGLMGYTQNGWDPYDYSALSSWGNAWNNNGTMGFVPMAARGTGTMGFIPQSNGSGMISLNNQAMNSAISGNAGDLY